MNDEFLHVLRRNPPPRFAGELKRRLDQQAWRRRRASILRTLVGVLLIGGVAMAALLLRERPEQSVGAVPLAHPVARSPFSGAGQPATSSPIEKRVAQDTNSPPSQTEPAESATGDIPVAFITSLLPRPLAQGLVGRLPKYGYLAQPRMAYMEDDEALRTLCAGNIDFVMVSRRISREQRALCDKWGIAIMEWKIGYQAVVFVAGPKAKPLAATPRDVFLALAGRIPDPAEPRRLVENPNVTWHDVDARFDEREINVVDGTLSGTFMLLLMEPGCETVPGVRALRTTDRLRYNSMCLVTRSDDHYRSWDLRFLRYQLEREPSLIVALDYSVYVAALEPKLHEALPATMLDGPEPTLATMADGTYSAARPVYVYAQRSHLDWNRAARKLADELTDPDAVGPDGYLVRLGLVPLDTRDSQRPPVKEHPR